MMKKLGPVLSIAGALFFVFLLAKSLQFDPMQRSNPLLGKQAPAFAVSDLSAEHPSNEISLSAFQGKPLVLNFWASWCHSCREESRDMEEFWQKYKSQGLLVMGISVQDEREDAQKFAKLIGKSYALGLDLTGNASVQYGITGVPETFFIDRNGVIKHKINGPVTLKLLEESAALIL